MIRIFLMSVRFGIPHHVEEFAEQIVRIMRSGRSLGMVLNAESRNRTVLQPLARVVVQVQVGNIDVVQIQRFRIYRETVILRGDLDLLPLDVQHRMVSAVVTELELVCPASKREAKNLVSQADSEKRLPAQQVPDIPDRIVHCFRIPWSVGEEDPIRFQSEDIFSRRRRWHYGNTRAAAREISQDVGFDSEVVGDYMKRRGFKFSQPGKLDEVDVLVRILVRLLDRDLAGEIPPDHLRGLLNLFQEGGFVVVDKRYDAAHRTLQADVTHQSARIDIRNGRYAVLRQVGLEALRRPPVAGHWRQVADDESFEERLPRFDVLGIDAGIADERIGHRNDLTGIGRVGKNFLVARHRSIENDFTHGLAFKAVSVASKNTPAFQQQRRLSFHSDVINPKFPSCLLANT